MGASAGGLEAIQAFFKTLPAQTGLSFVIVQHLSPDYKSLMDELIAKITPIPVRIAEDGALVERDTIYLIPPKKNMRIEEGCLSLMDQNRNQQTVNLPIDIFLASLAQDSKSQSIAMILSGTGSDGTRGSRAIKEAGGMVMVQEPGNAKFDGMPKNAISGGFPDFILPIENMAHQLMSYVKHPNTTLKTKSGALLEEKTGITRLFSLLREKSKIDFTYYKPNTVSRRIARRMTVNQLEDLNDYITLVERNSSELNTLFRELLIGVTSFFRDPELFAMLESKWLPEALEKAKGREFRIWISGVSTGEEAYSFAILCNEIVEKFDQPVDIKIFATDIDQDAIFFASNGIYPESITADVPSHLLNKYFFRHAESFKVSRALREMVVFAKHDLIKDPAFTNIDLVSCRNVLIYFQQPLQQKVVDTFNFSLRPEAILVLGPSETTGTAEKLFACLDNRWKVFRSRGQKSASPNTGAFSGGRMSLTNGFLGRQTAHATVEEDRVLARLMDVVGTDYLPFSMIVNESNELIYVFGESSSYLNPPTGRVINDVSKSVIRDLAIPLATGLTKVFNSRSEQTFSNIVIKSGPGERVSVNMRIKPLPDQKGKEQLAAVFIESTALKPAEPGKEIDTTTYDASQESQQRITDLEQELQFTRENLQATIEELETSNEELQATNEELLASNEELQSTNEELQSVNEELFTVNAEHQSKIMELTELNNDLHNFMNSGNVITLFLDEQLNVRRFTDNALKVWSLTEHDVGRPFDHLAQNLSGANLVDLVERANRTGETINQEVHTAHDSEIYLLTLQPYVVSESTRTGVVMSLSNITALKQAQDNEQRALERAKEEAEKSNDAKSNFLAAMSHDLRTPLNAVIGYSESILHEVFGPMEHEKYGDYIRIIHNSGYLLLSLVNDILDISKIEAGEYAITRSPCNMGELVEQSATLIQPNAKEKKIDVKFEIPGDLPPFDVDARALTQVFNNLFNNAVKYTGIEGTITAKVYQQGEAAVVEIIDTGIGMDEDQLRSAFEPFRNSTAAVASTEKGTGLGLYLCKRLMDMHGGTIELTSTPNNGLTATLHFPQNIVT
ncbi:chemotaxis protein CheB [Magnetovibrio sp. PR-2]|uniref:chemotaxis protein CheB n=1 Tax=Magnetovibrio sp. PR-2 TaxID=3120356 RepID=UPI002FCDF77E